MNTGETYGRLTAVAEVALNAQRQAMWRFACACGNELVALADNVERGRTASCGCWRQETGALYYTMPDVVYEFLFGSPNGRIETWEDVHGERPSVEVQQSVLSLYHDDRAAFDAMVQARADYALYGGLGGHEVPTTYWRESV